MMIKLYKELKKQAEKESTCRYDKRGAAVIEKGEITLVGVNKHSYYNCKKSGCFIESVYKTSREENIHACKALSAEIDLNFKAGFDNSITLAGKTILLTHKPQESDLRLLVNAGVQAIYFYSDESFDQTTIRYLISNKINFANIKTADGL